MSYSGALKIKHNTQVTSGKKVCLAFADYVQGTHGPLRDIWASIALSLLTAEANQAGLHYCFPKKSFVSCRPWLCGAVLTNVGRKKLKKWLDNFNQIRSVKVFKAPWKGKGLWNSHPVLRPNANQQLQG